MPHQVKTLTTVTLPDGATYPSGTVVTLTDAQYQALDNGHFNSGRLTDLGSVAASASALKAVTVTDAATITLDCGQGDLHSVTLGGNRTIAGVTGSTDGQAILLRIVQDATGSRTVTWGAPFHFGTTYPQPTLSTGPGKIDYLEFVRNGANRFDCVRVALGL